MDSAKYSELISYGYSELSAMVGATGTYCSTRTINGFKFNSSQISFQKTLNTSWDEYLKYHGNGTIDYIVIAEKNLQKSDLEYYNLTAKLSNFVKVIGSNRYQISYHWEDSNGNKPHKAVLEYYGLDSSRVYIDGTIEVDKIDFSDIYNYIRKDKSYNGLFDYYETIDQIVIPGPTLYHSYSSKKIDATSWEFSTYRALKSQLKQILYCDDDNEDLEVFINNDSSVIMNDSPKFTFISDDESFNISASLWEIEGLIKEYPWGEIEGLDTLNLDGYLTALRMIVADSEFQAKVIAATVYKSLPTLNSDWGVARRLEPDEINFVGKKNKTIKKGMHWRDFVNVMRRWVKWEASYCIDRNRERVPCYPPGEYSETNPEAVASIRVYNNRYDFKKFIVCFEILNIPNESRSRRNSKVADFYVIE